MPIEKDIQVRVGSASDAKEIADVGRTAFETAFTNEANRLEVDSYLSAQYSTEAILRQFDDPQCFFLVAEVEGGIIGFEQLYDRRPPGHTIGKWLMVDRLYILPEHIGTGLGGRLMDEGIALAKKSGMDWLWLMVLRSNERAAKFYRGFGMEAFGESPGKFEADGEMDDWMRVRV